MIYRPKNVPAELDVLDSPLLSPTPIGSALLGNVPGSALAERIFNDPTAWKTDDIIQGGGIGGRGAPGELILDPMSWFVDEVERFRLNSAASSSSSLNSASTDDGGLLTPPEKSRLGVIPGMMKRDSQQSLMGLTARHNVRPISLASLFDARSEEDFVKDIQAQMQMKTSGEQAGFGTGKTPHTADVFSPMSDATNSTVVSPAPIYSASTTLSFLDLYLESPGSKSGALRKSLYAKSQPRQGLGLKVTGEGMEKPRPVSLLSPLVHPDMSVEPVKRGSSVPPLDQLPVPSPQPNVSASVLSPEPKPILPPGLHQNLEVGETKPEEQEGEASKKDRAQEKVEAIPQKTQPSSLYQNSNTPSTLALKFVHPGDICLFLVQSLDPHESDPLQSRNRRTSQINCYAPSIHVGNPIWNARSPSTHNPSKIRRRQFVYTIKQCPTILPSHGRRFLLNFEPRPSIITPHWRSSYTLNEHLLSEQPTFPRTHTRHLAIPTAPQANVGYAVTSRWSNRTTIAS
ncbi:hypothetical protein CC1G_12489 [Coprinopsis cinerea okayama7|uniref:Uncharacterized protein n=1 Tax=Coprinopsis cinerea (strain Okayama-7 / 130 / ATCC MYA-4618 / FGSC 9003) TaxID=240176 RepID=A8P2T3_COPC7|nr:hypothetical protein CC1G_12489 [Coprinopsis cinerea okayama7\|eukprot:XP_001838397.1 hypothetical protein CC1G_12489 [Coprinopsis cinerea okayama7\